MWVPASEIGPIEPTLPDHAWGKLQSYILFKLSTIRKKMCTFNKVCGELRTFIIIIIHGSRYG